MTTGKEIKDKFIIRKVENWHISHYTVHRKYPCGMICGLEDLNGDLMTYHNEEGAEKAIRKWKTDIDSERNRKPVVTDVREIVL